MNGRILAALIAGIALSGAALVAEPSAASADATTCGSKENPCPLQKWMRQNMSGPMSSGDMAALAAAFDKAAALAPDPTWNGSDPKSSWDASARAGAAAARANDTAAVKATCKSCHDAFKDKYKAAFRTRPVR